MTHLKSIKVSQNANGIGIPKNLYSCNQRAKH